MIEYIYIYAIVFCMLTPTYPFARLMCNSKIDVIILFTGMSVVIGNIFIGD